MQSKEEGVNRKTSQVFIKEEWLMRGNRNVPSLNLSLYSIQTSIFRKGKTMSKIEVINFEEKVRKMKRSSKVNGFSGMIKMLRHSVDVFEFVGEDVEERLQKYSNLVGKDSKDFMLNPTDMKDSWNSLSCGNPAIFNFMSKEVNKEKYHLRICYNPVAESVATSFSKLSNGLPVAQYDSENNIWISHTGPEISEKFAKILDSGSPEADILEFLLEYHNPTEKDYQRIKQKYQKLFSLYNKTNCYMEPVFIIPKFAKKEDDVILYLVPRDMFRHGFCVGMEKNQLVLMQELHMDELMLNGYFYDVNDNYRKIVGRTDNVNTMRNSLYRLANRYTDDDIFTIPVSLNRYVESNNVKSLVKRAARKGAELNDVEKKNLNSFCSFIKKNIDISY